VSQDKYTKLARGEPCQVRLPGCDGGGETTVLAHYRLLALGSGIARRPHSLFGAYACFSCHNVIDKRVFIDSHSGDLVRLAHAEGVLKTINRLIDSGKLKV
jgi:putative nuclease YbcO-like protein